MEGELLVQAKRQALRWIRARDHSRQEMEQRLRAKGFPEPIVQQTLEWLLQERWLCDERVAQRLAERLEETEPSGRQRIEREFARRGLEPPATLASDEESRAVRALQQRFGEPTPPPDMRTVARWFRFLIQRGFEPEVAEHALHQWNPFLDDVRIDE